MSTEVSKFTENADGFGISSNVHGLAATRSRSWALETVCESWKEFSFGAVNVGTQWRHISCLVGPCASGMLVGYSLLMLWTDAD